MKRLFTLLSGLSLLTPTALAKPLTYECSPEIGRGEEILRLSLDLQTNKASLSINGTKVKECQGAAFTGELVEYGESEVLIRCRGGEVILRQDYDETVLDVRSLQLGLSDVRYMCN